MNLKKLESVFFFFLTAINLFAQYPANSPVAINGKLRVSGIKLVNANGEDYQLKGFATHGPQWYPQCYSQSSFNAMQNSWGANVIRLSMYVGEGGYNTDPAKWRVKLDSMIDWSAAAGIYCIIDWHVLTPGNPFDPVYSGAKDLWTYMATKHKGKAHVMYEICNEPNGTGVDWATIKNYADGIIPVIRNIDPSTIIICGTPHYSSRPQDVISNPLNYSNIMYTLHVYAGSNQSYDHIKNNVIPYVPIILTEFGTCDASGNTNYNAAASNTWLDIFDGANPSGVKISWCNWSFADKAETASALQPGSCSGGNWSNATAGGALVKARMIIPAIYSASNASGQVSIAFNYKISATNNPTSFGATGLPPGLTVNTSTGVISGTPSTAGTYTATVSASHANGTGTKKVIITIKPINTPYGGTPWMIPGTIQAENYDDGGEDIAYNDNGPSNLGGQQRLDQGVDVGRTADVAGTYDVGYTSPDEWLKYTVNVSDANTFTLQARVSSPNSGRSFRVEIDGAPVATVAVPNTGSWQTYQTVNVTTSAITAGKHTMRVYIVDGGFNLNYLNFVAAPVITSTDAVNGQVSIAFNYTITASNSPTSYSATGLPPGLVVNATTGVINGTPTAGGTYTTIVNASNDGGTGMKNVTITIKGINSPYDGTPWPVPGTIQAENYDYGGEGIAYHDNDVVNQGGQQRTNQGVDIGGTSDVAGTYDVGWTSAGEWLKYTVNVSTSNTFTLQARVASPNTGRSFKVEIDGATVATVAVPNTGSWQAYQTVNVTTSTITAGKHTMLIYIIDGGFNLNYINFAGADPAGVITAYKAPGAITVNGNLTEQGWNVTRSITKQVFGTVNNTATFGVMWDNTNLYIGARILDAHLFSDSPNLWEDDAVEIYIDANNNKLTTYDGLDNQIVKGFNKTGISTKLPIANLQHAWTTIPGGYSIEIAIPWNQLGITNPASGTSIGFDIGYNDDDNSGAREGQAMWNGTIDNWQNTSAFGRLTLNAGVMTKEAKDIDNTSLHEESLTVYPVPVTQGIATVVVPSWITGEAQVLIMNNAAQIVFRSDVRIEGSECELRIAELQPGMYFLYIGNGTNIVTTKIVIQN